MVSLEEWDGEAALQFYFEIPHFKHVSGVLEKILAERFKLRRFVAQAGAESV
jgi:quinol monooxygenase YgiN